MVQQITYLVLLFFPYLLSAQSAKWIYPDTLHLSFEQEEIILELGTREYDSTMLHAGMQVFFTYDAPDSAIIARSFTTDPQWICNYPKDFLQNDTVYNFFVCYLYRIGPINRYSGFTFSTPEGNKKITFRFKGQVFLTEKDE